MSDSQGAKVVKLRCVSTRQYGCSFCLHRCVCIYKDKSAQ